MWYFLVSGKDSRSLVIAELLSSSMCFLVCRNPTVKTYTSHTLLPRVYSNNGGAGYISNHSANAYVENEDMRMNFRPNSLRLKYANSTEVPRGCVWRVVSTSSFSSQNTSFFNLCCKPKPTESKVGTIYSSVKRFLNSAKRKEVFLRACEYVLVDSIILPFFRSVILPRHFGMNPIDLIVACYVYWKQNTTRTCKSMYQKFVWYITLVVGFSCINNVNIFYKVVSNVCVRHELFCLPKALTSFNPSTLPSLFA